jgi:UDP-N-acetylmuramate dehydrogenase
MNEIQKLIGKQLPSELVRYNESLARHTSFCIGGPADVFLTPRSSEELLQCLRVVRSQDLPYFLLGGGTNILVSDRGVRGVVIHTEGLASIKISGTRVVAEAGASVEDVCKAAAAASLSGLEFIFGMPGTIGGALWMNARCYDGSISDVLLQAEVITDDAGLKTVHHAAADYGYKRSPFQQMKGCILEVHLQLQSGDREEIESRMAVNYADRVAKGHFTAPSAGSLFKNNRDFGAPTGLIIDQLGLRGTVSGGAAIAPFHGNIFINQNNASAADVLALIRLAIETAKREKGILLEPEVRLVGEWLPEEVAFLKEKSNGPLMS